MRIISLYALCLLVGLFMISCSNSTSKVTPLSIDLPASYKSDSSAYHFIMNQVDVWNSFGKKVESMYRKGEKFRKKDFHSLSPRELYSLVKLDYEYAEFWAVQDVYLYQMMLEADHAMRSASEQGKAKIIEAQKLVSEYYVRLATHYGKDLKLDQEPLILSDDDSLYPRKSDSVYRVRLDSIYHQLMPKTPEN